MIMTHLRIEQQGTELNVSPSVISKLYQEAYVGAIYIDNKFFPMINNYDTFKNIAK